jgi:glucan-binding YG repeat protein
VKKVLAITSLLFLFLVAVLPQQAVKAASTYSATVTISGKEYKVNSVNNALVVNIDDLKTQNNLSETDKVEKISIETPNGAKSISGIGASALDLPDEAIPVVNNKVELVVADLLGELDSQQDGVALSTIREFLYPVNNKVMGQAEVDFGTKKENLTLVLSATNLLNVSKGTPVNVDSFSLTANGKVLTATKAKTGTNKFNINLAGFGIEDSLESIKLTSNTATTVSIFSRDSAFYSDVTDVKFANHVATLDRAKVTNWAANLGITVPNEVVLPVFMLNTVLTGSGITTLNGVVADDNGNQSPFSVTIQQYGWVQIDNVWYYILKNGEKALGWHNIGGTWYYFNTKTGAMQTGWLSDGGKWYFLDKKSGAMQTGWVNDGGKWYFLDNKSGAMQTGWVKDGGQWYFLDKKSGAMVTGLLKEGKSNYILRTSGAWLTGNAWVKDGNDWYYLTNNSAKLGWIKSGKNWYYLYPTTGKMVTGWTSVNGVWYFMSQNGAMVTGWAKVDGEWYYLKASGAMATGWVKVSNKWYYLYSNGIMAADTTIDGYKLGKNGAWIQ